MYSIRRAGSTSQPIRPIVLTCMAVIVVSILVSAYCTRIDTAVEEARGRREPFGFSDLLKDVLAVLGNRNYLFVVREFFPALTAGTHETLAIYMAIYFWELTPYQQGWLAINTLIGYQIAFLLRLTTRKI